MRINFIQSHLVTRIRSSVELIFKNENYHGFLWLDNPIYDKKHVINRLGPTNPFQVDEILPLSWYALEPKNLLKIYNMILDNKVYLQLREKTYYINLKAKKLEK